MEPCKDFFDKIIFYNDLNEIEKHKTKRHIEECAKCQKHWQEFQKVQAGLGTLLANNHINDEILQRYTVFLADPEIPDFDGRVLTKSEIKQIESHTGACNLCRQKLVQLQRDYLEVADYFNDTDLPDLSLDQKVPVANKTPKTSFVNLIKDKFGILADEIRQKVFSPTPGYFPIALGTMAVLFAVIWFGPFFRAGNPYFDLTNVEKNRVTVVTRGTTSETLGRSLDAFKAGDYQSSIDFLESYLTTEQSELLQVSAHYLLGLSYFLESRTDILGRFQKIDQNLVKKAIINLQIAKNASNNKTTMEECDWYIAKAYLLQGDVEKARLVLAKLQNSQGRRYFDANDLIQKIEKITQAK